MDRTENVPYDAEPSNRRSPTTSETHNRQSSIEDPAKILENAQYRSPSLSLPRATETSNGLATNAKPTHPIPSNKRTLNDVEVSRCSRRKIPKIARRKTLTSEERAKLIGLLEAGLSVRSVAMALNVSSRLVATLKKTEVDAIARERSNDPSNPAVSSTKGRSTVNSGLDRSLQLWYMQKRSLGMAVSDDDLKNKALVFNAILNGANSLRVNNLWLHKFRARYRLGDSSTDEASIDGEAGKFYEEFSAHLGRDGCAPDRVYNAVETSVTWKSLPDRFIETHEDNDRLSDHRVTVMICSNATGSHKLPLMVIGKEANPRCFRGIKVNPVVYKSQPDAWMDDELFAEWYESLFLPAIEERHGRNQRCVLLLDNAPPHRPARPLNSVSDAVNVVYLPPSLTPEVQPLSRGVVDKVKRAYKMNLFRQVLLDDGSQTPALLLKSLTMLFFCNYVAAAWESVAEADVADSWRRIFPPENGSAPTKAPLEAKHFFKMLRQIPNRGHVTVREMNSWLEDDDDPGWKILTDDEILASVRPNDGIDPIDGIKTEVKEEIETEDDATEDDQGYVPSAGDALIGCNYVEGWIQNRPECTQEHLAVLRQLRELALDVSLAEKECFN